MDPNLLNAIMRLLGQGSNLTQGQLGTQAAGFGQQQSPLAESLNLSQNFSPVQANQNYAGTVGQFFENSALAGGNRFVGAQPLRSGPSGSHAARGGSYWSSIPGPNHDGDVAALMDALRPRQ